MLVHILLLLLSIGFLAPRSYQTIVHTARQQWETHYAHVLVDRRGRNALGPCLHRDRVLITVKGEPPGTPGAFVLRTHTQGKKYYSNISSDLAFQTKGALRDAVSDYVKRTPDY